MSLQWPCNTVPVPSLPPWRLMWTLHGEFCCARFATRADAEAQAALHGLRIVQILLHEQIVLATPHAEHLR